MIKIFLLSLALLLPLSAQAQETEPSLFFTEGEIRAIEAELAAHPQEFQIRSKRKIYLDSILYVQTGSWSVWLQGEKWTPHTEKKSLKILDVTPSSILLEILPPLVQTKKNVRLKPHQSFDLITGKIGEGF